MSELSMEEAKEELKNQLIALSERRRRGSVAPKPIVLLEPAQSFLLQKLLGSVLPPDANDGGRRRAAIALLEWIVRKSDNTYVLCAGDMLGLTELDDADVRKWFEEYWQEHPGNSQAPKKFARYARSMRFLIVAHHRHDRQTIASVSRKEPEWISALVDEITDLLANKKELTRVAMELGLVDEPEDSISDETVPAVSARDPVPPPQSPGKTRRRWLIPIAIATAAALGAVTAVVFDLAGSSDPPAEPLLVNTSWPLVRGCDAATAVAMLPGKAQVGSFATSKDPRRDIATADGGGAWVMGYLYLNLAGTDDSPVQILDIKPNGPPTPIPAPAWTLGVEGGCGDSYERVFRLDLDKPSIEDVGVQGTSGAATDVPRTEPLGPAFEVTDREPALVRVDAVACKGNYEWSLVIRYFYKGEEGSKIVGPYRTMARADNTTSYTQYHVDGRVQFVKNGPLSGTFQVWPC